MFTVLLIKKGGRYSKTSTDSTFNHVVVYDLNFQSTGRIEELRLSISIVLHTYLEITDTLLKNYLIN